MFRIEIELVPATWGYARVSAPEQARCSPRRQGIETRLPSRSHRSVEFGNQGVLDAFNARDSLGGEADRLAFFLVLHEAEEVDSAILNEDVLIAQLGPGLGGEVLDEARTDGVVALNCGVARNIASTFRRSLRVTIPTSRPLRRTGRRLICWRWKSLAASTMLALSGTVTTPVRITSRAIRPCVRA